MKPRLPSAVLTEEDQFVWFLVCLGVDPQREHEVFSWALGADRRHAGLMFEAAVLRRTIDLFTRGDRFSHRYHRVLYQRFLAHGERPVFSGSVLAHQ